ncbi:hypothetical protein JCM10908_002536 [Rhodotorula pacifica]|uniref:OB fold domain-containing protein n=1 Tax=Rhodotorula pacifica TaxID=1495444 RepID=UPI003176DB66
MSAPIPEALHRWYRSSYPTLSFNPEWLQACVDYLVENEPSAKGSVPGLIKAVEVQLLSSDLDSSVIPPSTLPAYENETHVDPSVKRQVLFRATGGGGDEPSSSKGMKPSTATARKKAGVLVQVMEVDDVAHSALSLVDTLSEKKEARKLAAKGARAGGGEGRIMDLHDDEQHPEEEDLDAEAKRKALATGAEPTFPRGSGRFVLGDGGPKRWVAFELQKIAGLGLEEIKLGTKLLIHDVPCINGILMLTPQNTIVKGYQVEELEVVKEWHFENAFRARLGLKALPDPREAVTPEPAPAPPPPVPAAARPAAARNAPAPCAAAANRQPKSDPIDEDDGYFGDDLDLADFEMADQLAQAQGVGRARGVAQQQQMNRGQAGGGGEDNDDDDDDEEEALREMLRLEAAANFKPGPTPSPVKPKLASSTKPTSTSSRTTRQNGRPAIGKSHTGVSGRVEVLDLDSADEEDGNGDGDAEMGEEREEEDVKPLRKKIKAEPRVGGATAGGPKRTTVIEIDSD